MAAPHAPGHHTHYSIHDDAWWCDDCPWTDGGMFDESEEDALVAEE